MSLLFAHPLARARAGIVAVLALPLLLPLVGLRADRMFALISTHVAVVTCMSAVALAVAVLASRAAWQRYDVRAALVASGFVVIGGMLVVHGLSTPGGPIFAEFRPTVQVAGVLALPVGALFLAAAMAMPPRVRSGRRAVAVVQLGAFAGVVLFAVVGFAAPGVLPTAPLMTAPTSYFVLVPTLVLFGWAAWRAHMVAELTRRGGDAAVFAGIVILAVAVVAYVTSTPFDVQFWLGHALELVGFTCVSAGIAADLRRPRSSWRLTQRGEAGSLGVSSEELLGGYVHALTVTLSQVDPSTWHHSRRVAELAVEVGEQLALEPAAVRRLAVAGLVHDIGKLRIPHSVLHKPGKLTDEEFELVKSHPDFGAELLSQLRGFDEELVIVLGHHEKLSGRGYPEGLAGDEIDIETRIMTACDVYDALTDSRSYKEPWPLERAIALLHEESGESFDASVVTALEHVVRRRANLAWEAGDAPVPASPVAAIMPIDAPSGLPFGRIPEHPDVAAAAMAAASAVAAGTGAGAGADNGGGDGDGDSDGDVLAFPTSAPATPPAPHADQDADEDEDAVAA